MIIGTYGRIQPGRHNPVYLAVKYQSDNLVVEYVPVLREHILAEIVNAVLAVPVVVAFH